MFIFNKAARFINKSAGLSKIITLADSNFEQLFKKPEIVKQIQPVKEKTVPELLKLAASEGLVSLSAVQIGISERVFVIHKKPIDNQWTGYSSTEEDYNVVINPRITTQSDGLKDQWEVCPSLPEIKALCRRYSKIKLIYYDLEGSRCEAIKRGFEARVIQHEDDHIKGCLTIVTSTSEGRVLSTNKNVTLEMKAMQKEIDRRKAELEEVYAKSLKFRKNISAGTKYTEMAINALVMTHHLNAYYMTRSSGQLAKKQMPLIRDYDKGYSSLVSKYSKDYKVLQKIKVNLLSW